MLKDKNFWGLILSVLLMMAGVGMIVALLPQRVIDLDGNAKSVGYLASTFAFSYLLLQLPLGSMADKIGFKPFLVGGYILCAIAGVVFYFAQSSNMIFLARILQGAGEAPVWALAPALLSLRFPLAKGKVMGIYNAALHIGLTTGPILGIGLAAVLKAEIVFLVYSAGCIAGAIVICLLVAPAGKQQVELANWLDLRKIFALARQKQTLISLLGITFYGAGYGIFLTAVPAFLLQERALGAAGVGVFFSLFYVAVSISQIITGPLSDRFGRKIFMITGLFVAAAGMMAAPGLEFPVILLSLTVASLGMGVFYLASMAFLNDSAADSMKGTVSGAYYLFWGAGYFFGPLIITKIATTADFQVAMAAFSLMVLSVAVAMTKILGLSKKRQA